jgi:hypothetical protein
LLPKKTKKEVKNKKLISEKYSQEEISNINEIEQLLNKDNQYVSIGIGNKAILQFLPEREIKEVEKTYNGQLVKKIRFTVIDPNSGTNIEKNFDVGKRSARLIIAKLKEGHTLLKIERIGSGKDTLFISIPVVVSSMQ